MLCDFVEYREAFKCFDLNENGTLSTKELKYAMRMLGSNPTDSQVQELVNEKDFDGKALCLLTTLVVHLLNWTWISASVQSQTPNSFYVVPGSTLSLNAFLTFPRP